MIDFRTISFLKDLDNITVLTAAGIKPFSDATADSMNDFLFYDDGAVRGDAGFPVVRDACVDHIHHDIISCYDDNCYGKDYTIRVVFDENGKPFVKVTPGNENKSGENMIRIIEDGYGYFV